MHKISFITCKFRNIARVSGFAAAFNIVIGEHSMRALAKMRNKCDGNEKKKKNQNPPAYTPTKGMLGAGG